jgi:poly-gamma-glutamate synthesis protein (capsule biosynthesis protein)
MQKTGEVSFCAAGDVMLDRGVRKRIVENGLGFVFQNTGGFTKVRNVSFCNLECTASERGTRKNGGYAFRADPGYIKAVEDSGFNIVSVANNHMMDYGGTALLDTLKSLDKYGIAYAGAGASRELARQPKIMEVNGVRIALLADLDMPTIVEEVPENPFLPQMSQRRGTPEMVNDIKLAKKQADIVMVSFHWGYEYTNYPLKDMTKLAKVCVDAGADIILGHHPHVIQGIEIYKGKPIIYSMGNFVFDQFREMTSRTFIFACDFFKDGSIKNAFITPVLINKNRPEFAKGTVAEEIRVKIMKISKKFGTKFIVKDGRMYLEGI